MGEKKPIIKLFFYRPKEAEHRRPEDERKDYYSKLAKKLEELGVKSIVVCDCRWSNEEWAYFGVNEFPSIEAVQELAKWLDEQESWRYGESKSYLGTR